MTSTTSENGTAGGQGTGATDPGCDPGLLDELTCRAERIAAEAAYNASIMEELTQARTRYNGARAAYSGARDPAEVQVRDLGQQLRQVIDQLKCLVNDDRTIARLDRAFREVERRLADCGDQSGCYFQDDCDFDAAVRDCRPEDVAGRIADIDRRVKAAKAAFDDLIAEPTKLPERVTALQAEIAAIVASMADDSRSVDFKRLYAAALVARRHRYEVWRGFENTNTYVDCLCRTLTCQVRGHAAISTLKGVEAEEKCKEREHDAACDRLRTQTVDEVMAEYLRIVSREGYDTESSDQDRGPGGQDRGGYGRNGGEYDREGNDRDRGEYDREGRGRNGSDRGEYDREGYDRDRGDRGEYDDREYGRYATESRGGLP
jgi:hypothetical protein